MIDDASICYHFSSIDCGPYEAWIRVIVRLARFPAVPQRDISMQYLPAVVLEALFLGGARFPYFQLLCLICYLLFYGANASLSPVTGRHFTARTSAFILS